MIKRPIYTVLIVLFWLKPCFSQDYRVYKRYTTSDGLPSNHIYKCVEDNRGFLWVATDAGIARFDGKTFQVFTTKQGLPDNEVLDVVKENNGRIWVNCFKQSPAYFDEVKNKFINAKMDSNLAKVSGTTIMQLFVMEDGGVQYVNENGSYIFKNSQIKTYTNLINGISTMLLKEINKNQALFYAIEKIGKLSNFMMADSRDKNIEKKIFANSMPSSVNKYLVDGKLYFFSIGEKRVLIFKNFQTAPLRFEEDTINLNEPILHVTFSKNYINVVTGKAKLYVFDKQTLKQIMQFSGNYTPNSLWIDGHENIFIGSIDKGLIVYRKQIIDRIPIPDNYVNTHFLSIAKDKKGILYAGGFTSEIITANGKSFEVNPLKNPVSTSWQRKIIIQQNNVYSFSEGGSFLNYSTPLTQVNGTTPYYTKTALLINDSTIITAPMAGLNLFNTKTNKAFKLFARKKRMTSIALGADGYVYSGSTDSLYRYDIVKDTGNHVPIIHPLISERVMGLAATPDSLIWIATASNGVVVIKKNQLIAHFTQTNGLIADNSRCITAGKKNQIWLGTGEGVSVINYQFKHSQLKIVTHNLSENDGLTNNIVNELLFDHDTIYAATGNGISIIPATIKIPSFAIPVVLTGVKINQKDTAILNEYQLAYNQNNIQLQFAGIELSGHFNHFQYTLNDNANWIDLFNNTLSLQLTSGKHIIQVRAVDVNGHNGPKPLLVRLNIDTPFWKTWWFWLIITTVLILPIFYAWINNERKKRNRLLAEIQSKQLVADLEMQAIKAQMNPHFIFNCLSSIQSLTYQKRTDEAGIFINQFSQLMRSTLDFSAQKSIKLSEEIAYVKNYLSLEKMRFGEKLHYQINIDPPIVANALEIPPLLLQPYLENAIKHGLNHLEDSNGMIVIGIEKVENILICTIQDNGVGREKSAQINANQLQYHLSKGMLLTKRREEIYGIQSTIIDLVAENGKSLGTKVILRIPLT